MNCRRRFYAPIQCIHCVDSRDRTCAIPMRDEFRIRWTAGASVFGARKDVHCWPFESGCNRSADRSFVRFMMVVIHVGILFGTHIEIHFGIHIGDLHWDSDRSLISVCWLIVRKAFKWQVIGRSSIGRDCTADRHNPPVNSPDHSDDPLRWILPKQRPCEPFQRIRRLNSASECFNLRKLHFLWYTRCGSLRKLICCTSFCTRPFALRLERNALLPRCLFAVSSNFFRTFPLFLPPYSALLIESAAN